MKRNTITFTISLPPEMMQKLEEVRKKEHRTRSELIREALREYMRAEIERQCALPSVTNVY